MRTYIRYISLVSLAATYFLAAIPASAQISSRSMAARRPVAEPSAARAVAPAFTDAEKACQYFVHTPFKADQTLAGLATKLTTCAKYLHDYIPEPTGAVAGDVIAFGTKFSVTATDDIDEQLITTHYQSRVLRRWATKNKSLAGDPSNPDAIFTIDMIDRKLHPMMKYRGLLELMAGSLVAGPAIGITGQQGTAKSTGGTGTGPVTSLTGTAAASSTSTTNSLAHIEFGSQHFGAEKCWPADVSFGGSFGVQPALTLLQEVSKPEAAKTSQYQSAFVWDLNGKTNIHLGSNAEGSLYGRLGQIHLLTGNGATIVDKGADSILMIPLNSGADQAAWFGEFGGEFNLFSKALEVVHGEKSQLSPLFNVAVGYRYDNRFKKSNGLADFDAPDRRLVFRFMVNGLKIFDRRPDTTRTTPFDVSFGVEREQGFGNHPVPAGTRIIVHADIALLKLINPGGGS